MQGPPWSILFPYGAAIAVIAMVAFLCVRAYRSELARRVAEARLLRTIRATGVGPWERNVVTDVYWLAPEWLELLSLPPEPSEEFEPCRSPFPELSVLELSSPTAVDPLDRAS